VSQKRKAKSEKSPCFKRPENAKFSSGCWINIFDPSIGELVGNSGYDYAMIDMEHSPVSLDSTLSMIRAVQSGGAKAVVRVPDKQPLYMRRLAHVEWQLELSELQDLAWIQTHTCQTTVRTSCCLFK